MDSPAGFSDYVAAQRSSLMRTAYLLTADVGAAEDLTQATLVRVWPRWAKASHGPNVHAYVRKTMLTIFLNWRRRPAIREISGQGLELTDSRNAFEQVDVAQQMIVYLRRLPPRQRAVVVVRYYLDFSEADAADLLGCSTGTVKSQTAKALAKLRVLLEDSAELYR
jgi:RNA polymerase sigma-70 factor (sigma-E family)